LIETLIAVGIMMVVTGATFALMDPAQGMFAAQPEVMDMQQRLRIGVDTHPAEIVAEAGFHEHARGWVEALTRCGQYLVDDARDCAVSRVTRPGTR
jgi:hypothetical protein